MEPIDYAIVLSNATAYSSYSKFDPYLFNTDGLHPNGKGKLFKKWGYTVDDAQWLQSELERRQKKNTFQVITEWENLIYMGRGLA